MKTHIFAGARPLHFPQRAVQGDWVSWGNPSDKSSRVERLKRGGRPRSADLQSAVARVSNPPTAGERTRLADWKSAIQQVGNLRYPGAVHEGAEDFYRIANYDRMRPFFLSLVSAGDHWMFVSSTGALTAGRGDADHALFPYYTEDKIHDSAGITGSRTLLLVRRGNRWSLWQPFSDEHRGLYRVRRNLLKNVAGTKLLFEEINEDLALTFRYEWSTSRRFGFVRRAWLTNDGPPVRIRVLDGLQNLLPAGLTSQFQLEKSVLADAYKKNELLPETGLGLFTLSSIPIDRPEPAESLRATTVWCVGPIITRLVAQHASGSADFQSAVTRVSNPQAVAPVRRLEVGDPAGWKPVQRAVLLSSRQLDNFRRGEPLQTETDIRAERGAYFVQADLRLRRGQTADWLIVADVERGPSDVAELNTLLRRPSRLRRMVLADVERNTQELRRLVAVADGLQTTAHPIGDARHFNNVLFNIMRGGVFERGYEIDPQDLHAFVTRANCQVAARHAAFFRRLKAGLTYPQLVARAVETGDPQLERLCREYLPLTFSRRHGDPSRPWNRFSIAPLLRDGRRAFWYEGNWRDLFQNWEALARSFPRYTAGMICKFLNASTADGYNPYRITRDGIEWEVVDPHDPWSFIGYWGDHQIIYLLKLLEILQSHEPGTLAGWLSRPIFAYANVPYRIKPYPALLANPKDTVRFDEATQRLVTARVRECGADGRLVWDANGRVRLVTLTEKLLVPVLAKLSNFIPEAGIWLNTQRPEWNDANNALVGNGASVVTLCYLRRHLAFLRRLFESQSDTRVAVAREVAAWFDAVHRALQRHCPLLSRPIRDRDRKRVLDALGRAGSAYRERLYRQGFSGQTQLVGARQLLGFFDIALAWLDHSIRANRRRDGLFHAYNLVGFERGDALPIRRLDLMLEGQVAALSAGCLTAEESLRLLRALRESALYRADQHSYLLYPDRRLPRFVEKNNIPARALARSALLRRLVADGNRVLVERDVTGRFHFQGDIRNAADVRRKLAELSTAGYERLVRKDARLVLQIFEDVFDHQSFTGRSGTFFGYEGLGCIYWHMVSKLLLAAQETFFRAVESGAPETVCRQLGECYHDIRAGLGDHKTPAQYGAFPMDPYSHTPGQGGARQPGLTGQVKEDILCRWGELGVFVEAGRIRFRPRLLREDEFLRAPGEFRWSDASGRERRLSLPAGSLAFTYCHVPIVYRLGDRNRLTVFRRDGTQQAHDSLELDEPTSRSLFQRTGDVARIVVWLRG